MNFSVKITQDGRTGRFKAIVRHDEEEHEFSSKVFFHLTNQVAAFMAERMRQDGGYELDLE